MFPSLIRLLPGHKPSRAVVRPRLFQSGTGF